MPSPGSPRKRRKTNIPSNYVLSWQSSGTRGSNALVRRPVTACEPCRIAKAKCDGKKACARCVDRCERCVYTTASTAELLERSNGDLDKALPGDIMDTWADPSATDTGASLNLDLGCGGDMGPLEPSHTLIHGLMSDAATMPRFDVQLYDELSMESASDTVFASNKPGFAQHHYVDPALSNLSDWSLLQDMDPPVPSMSPSNASHSLKIGRKSSLSSSSNRSTSTFPTKDASPKKDCQCRVMLTQCESKVRSAMERPEPHHDEVFSSTSEIIRICQRFFDCAICTVTCTDLLCIMAVFQQTTTCFEFAARADIKDELRVGIGKYEISLGQNQVLRQMLVMDLVQQATKLLDACKVLGQEMALQCSETSKLASINLSYLSDVVENFRDLLRAIKEIS